MKARFETVEEAGERIGETDENWKSCKHCGCYSFRHKIKTTPLSNLPGDARLKGYINCTQCGKDCQLIKQNIVKQPDILETTRTMKALKAQLRPY